MNGIDTLLNFRPSLKQLLFESWQRAKGFPYPHRFFLKEQDECFFCGKKEDYLFGFVTFVPVYFGENYGIRYICNSHKGEWWNCQTGIKVISSGKSKLLSLLHQIILGLAIPARFVWFFLYSGFMWHIAIYPYYWYRQLKK